MRLFAVLVAVLAVVLLVLAVAAAFGMAGRRRAARLHAGARWRLHHFAERGETVVAVALALPDGRLLDQHVVDRFPDTDPEWERRFLHAREEAERRAFHLNADRPPPLTS
jgi:pyridoxamine 5'-phosphate oxidase family protein